MKHDLAALPKGSTVLLHACAHNPSGVDPTQEQWRELLPIFEDKEFLPFFDSAYQGYASGDPDADAFSIRLFEAAGLNPIVAQSYAKNLGVYGERVGAVNIVCSSVEEKNAVLSQLGYTIARPMYSSCPLHGSRIAAMVLSDPELRSEWMTELKTMSGRIVQMRQELTSELVTIGTPGDWCVCAMCLLYPFDVSLLHYRSHINNQIGMFAFTGLSPESVDTLREDFHIYMTR